MESAFTQERLISAPKYGNGIHALKQVVCQNMETCSHQEAIRRPKHGKCIHTRMPYVQQNMESSVLFH